MVFRNMQRSSTDIVDVLSFVRVAEGIDQGGLADQSVLVCQQAEEQAELDVRHCATAPTGSPSG